MNLTLQSEDICYIFGRWMAGSVQSRGAEEGTREQRGRSQSGSRQVRDEEETRLDRKTRCDGGTVARHHRRCGQRRVRRAGAHYRRFQRGVSRSQRLPAGNDDSSTGARGLASCLTETQETRHPNQASGRLLRPDGEGGRAHAARAGKDPLQAAVGRVVRKDAQAARTQEIREEGAAGGAGQTAKGEEESGRFRQEIPQGSAGQTRFHEERRL